MVNLSLNIYGENDEILKTYETRHLRWQMLTEAARLQDEIDGMDTAEQLEVVSNFILSVFVGMTREELALADMNDVLNTFNMIVKQAGSIKAAKNA